MAVFVLIWIVVLGVLGYALHKGERTAEHLLFLGWCALIGSGIILFILEHVLGILPAPGGP